MNFIISLLIERRHALRKFICLSVASYKFLAGFAELIIEILNEI